MLILKLVAQRVALGVLLLFAASILIFVGTQILPGDVAQSILGQSATPEALVPPLVKEITLLKVSGSDGSIP